MDYSAPNLNFGTELYSDRLLFSVTKPLFLNKNKILFPFKKEILLLLKKPKSNKDATVRIFL
jgi:hypothetical protein